MLGALNGHAQAVVESAPEAALADADELERDSVFMAPQAEVIRTSVCAMRGEVEGRARHRARAETLAFRGGMSWSATVLLVVRTLHLVEEAKRLCERKLQALTEPRDEQCYGHQLLSQQLALAEAALGNLPRARALLARQLELLTPSGSPLRLGLVERDLADVALLARDRAAFEHHFAAVDAHFRGTRSPALFQLRDALLNRAAVAGVREPALSTATLRDGLDGETELVGRGLETDLELPAR